MKQLQTMPGYRVNEYRIVLYPHEELRNRIQKIRKDFANEYVIPMISQRAHLTLVRFEQHQLLEERLVNRLNTIAMGHHPFKVELKDFGSYPSHTIFIQVTSKMPIKDLVSELKALQRLMKMDKVNKPHFLDNPQFVVATRMLPWQYEKAWQNYSSKNFTARFIADSLLLLKRPKGETPYQIVQRFEFMNLPVSTRQGDLFGKLG